MDDTAKGVVFGFLGLIVLHASLERRATHDATSEVERAFQHTGFVRTRVEARGMFGAVANSLYSIDVYGSGLRSDRLPFVAVPRRGWKGSIRHLRLHFDNLTLKGLPVDRFEADIPNVTYDLGRALYQDRLVIRGAGEGPASVRIGPDGLRTFVLRKYSRIFSEVRITFRDGRVVITGNVLLFGTSSPFQASGDLDARGNRYVDLTKPIIEMNGKRMNEATTANILKLINPVLDLSADLGLTGYFTLTSVQIDEAAITVYGRAGVPTSSSGILIK